MRTEDKYKNEVSSKFEAEDHFAELAAKLELKSEKKSSKLPLFASLGGIAALGLTAGIVVAIALNAFPTQVEKQTFTVGKITDQTKKEKASQLYSNSYTTLSNMEDDNSTSAKSLKKANDLTTYAYHADYKLHYEMQASLLKKVAWAELDEETYSLDLIKDENGVRFQMTNSVTLNEETPLTEYSASQSVQATYQGGNLYVKGSVSYNNSSIDFAYYYSIVRSDIFEKFPEYFISMVENAKFDDVSDEENINLINTIINKDEAEVVDANSNSVSIKTDTDEATITTGFDIDSSRFNSIKFDYSKLAQEIKFNDYSLLKLDKYEFTTEMNFKYDGITIDEVDPNDYTKIPNFLHYSAFDKETSGGYDESRSYHGGHDKTEY